MTRRGWILFALMAVIWGIPYLLIKIAVTEMPPVTLVFGRTALGTLVLLPLAAARGWLRPLVPRWRWVLAYTLAEVMLPWLLLSDSETRLSSSLAGLLIAAVPFVGVLLIWIFGGDDRPDARRIGGLVLGFIGVALVVGFNVSADDLGAVVEVGLVALGYAIGAMIIARRLRDLPAAGVIAVSLTLTAVVYAVPAIGGLPHALSGRAILAVAVLGLLCTAGAFVLFFQLIAEVGPNRATVITYFNPAVAIVAGALFLSEPITLAMLAGFALLAVGSYIGTRRRAPAPA